LIAAPRVIVIAAPRAHQRQRIPAMATSTRVAHSQRLNHVATVSRIAPLLCVSTAARASFFQPLTCSKTGATLVNVCVCGRLRRYARTARTFALLPARVRRLDSHGRETTRAAGLGAPAGGAPLQQLWTNAGLAPHALHEPDRFVPLHLINRFVEDAAAQAGIDDLGLAVARQSSLQSLGPFGAGVCRSLTLHHAIATARDTTFAHNSAARYWLVMEGDAARSSSARCWKLDGPISPSRRVPPG
jgi:hypothetical protein